MIKKLCPIDQDILMAFKSASINEKLNRWRNGDIELCRSELQKMQIFVENHELSEIITKELRALKPDKLTRSKSVLQASMAQ